MPTHNAVLEDRQLSPTYNPVVTVPCHKGRTYTPGGNDHKMRRHITLVFAALILSIAYAGFVSLLDPSLAGPIPGPVPASEQVLLNGAGATFPYPIYSKWFDEYHKLHPEIQINYQSIGSGGGIRQVIAGTVDFGASDGPMTDEQLSQLKFKLFHIPTVLGSVVPAYNISGVTGEIKFSPDVLANIFLGKITNWNDKALAKDNPDLHLPD